MSFTYHRPHSLPEVFDLLERLGEGTHLMAGGTDLMVLLERRKLEPRHVVSLLDVEGLGGIRAEGDRITLGALVTHREVERSPLFQGALAALPEACATVGGIQVRNLGTIAGNLANASPAADTPPPLLCMDATVSLASRGGERRLPLDQFFLDYRRTTLRPGEVLTAISIPRAGPRTATSFRKLGRRQAMEISIVCVAARLSLGPDGQTIEDARVALGAVAPTAIRCRAAEDVLRGRRVSEAAFREAGRLAVEAARPVDDLRASAHYRRKAIAALVPRALGDCLARLSAAAAS